MDGKEARLASIDRRAAGAFRRRRVSTSNTSFSEDEVGIQARHLYQNETEAFDELS
jgi:hypothetical protein